jgi:hypothetical protein
LLDAGFLIRIGEAVDQPGFEPLACSALYSATEGIA